MSIELEVLQVAIGTRKELSHTPSDAEWNEIYRFADEQAIVGVMFGGIEKLPKHQLPNMDLLMDWLGQVEYLKTQNEQVLTDCRMVAEVFGKAGFKTCLLKGIGNQLFYGGLVRTPGDIDLWVMPEGVTNIDEARRQTQAFVQGIYPEARGEYVHMDWPWKEPTTVEVHFVPSMDGIPSVEKRLVRFFEEREATCFANMTELGVCVPDRVTNGVFLLHHMKRHFIQEGIGLRHVVDYALLLRSMTDEERKEVWNLLQKFGMARFAGAVMWILAESLEVRDERLLCKPDERRGRFLLKEIYEGGNFGKHDKRKGEMKSAASRWWWFVKVALIRMRMFPEDTLWAFIMRLKVGVSNVIHK